LIIGLLGLKAFSIRVAPSSMRPLHRYGVDAGS
jgi:hypothetical protein